MDSPGIQISGLRNVRRCYENTGSMQKQPRLDLAANGRNYIQWLPETAGPHLGAAQTASFSTRQGRFCLPVLGWLAWVTQAMKATSTSSRMQ